MCVFLFSHVALPFPSASITPLPLCVLLLDGPAFTRVVVSFWGISQHSCNDKSHFALWPTKPNPQTHSSRVIPDGWSLQQERHCCYIFSAGVSVAFLRQQNQRDCGGFGLFSITPQLTVKLTSLFKDVVSTCDDDAFDRYKHEITVKQHWVVFLREMIPLSYAKGGHDVNVQGQREGGSREDLSVSFISSLPTI